MKLRPIKDQVVVVFGASSGIGRETALRFARKGARVVVSARDAQGLDTLVSEIHEEGGYALAVPADATDPGQAQEVADTARRRYGRLDTWVHTASVIMYAPFEQTRPEEFRQVLDINLMGVVHGIYAALPLLQEQGRGALIVVSSVEGRQPFPLQSAYVASKHGLEGLLGTLRMELKRSAPDISLTNVIPSSIDTPIFNKARTRLSVKSRGVPPFYDPAVAARAILFAAENRVPEIWVGGAGRALLAIKRVAPALVDDAVARMAPRLQRTDEPRTEDSPDNLFHPLPGHATVRGGFGGRSFSLYTWLQMQPMLRMLLTWATLGGVSWVVRRGAEPARSRIGDGMPARGRRRIVRRRVVHPRRVQEARVGPIWGDHTHNGATPRRAPWTAVERALAPSRPPTVLSRLGIDGR
ncbi:MAG TPA: SDR family NAD(P)-dependent oxidoreductase [Chloroflexi bacterium]|nr:SDR family NAD(P)-dependent oxidoreductase [Chloroflexota bacterium]